MPNSSSIQPDSLCASNASVHVPVMLEQMLQCLEPRDDEIYLDCTFGGGGYSSAILNYSNCNVIAIDRDEVTKQTAKAMELQYGSRFRFIHSRYSSAINLFTRSDQQIRFDGIVMDLGLSQMQLDDENRGFSFNSSGKLSMAMGLNDYDVLDFIHSATQQQIADVIYHYGEETGARRVAKAVFLHKDNIKNTRDLAHIVRKSLPKRGKIDNATKTFQALRIHVNQELQELEYFCYNMHKILNIGARIIIVNFHSLEDRIVKNFFKLHKISKVKKSKWSNNDVILDSGGGAKPMIAPEEVDIEQEARRDEYLNLVYPKPLTPSGQEIVRNYKARSAKMRVAVYEPRTYV
ncbi:Ribosomal RNA small subunit methyltransferase H [Rickettsiales endosymbiont of Paramecium tredecaurelia]|uniref:16S rRNA (cytosine(1402)-N(4))-methyltransferase RsmH n=1 Tax=Candidatus Sarmatiella mevalonica TaxID=2770581 RepID=UPI001924367A|nr:16S rRNA (cytosine(1402)-N(4))-methyltransferase RsmH [Candidatus Sarmatiella mevalonica]MBL3284178.1 Ribosomal RNA small subunit methyltransferase H [Candidatus Sarmatiella mevalonica]